MPRRTPRALIWPTQPAPTLPACSSSPLPPEPYRAATRECRHWPGARQSGSPWFPRPAPPRGVPAVVARQTGIRAWRQVQSDSCLALPAQAQPDAAHARNRSREYEWALRRVKASAVYRNVISGLPATRSNQRLFPSQDCHSDRSKAERRNLQLFFGRSRSELLTSMPTTRPDHRRH